MTSRARAIIAVLLAAVVPACGSGDTTIQQVVSSAAAPSGSIIVLGQNNEIFFVDSGAPTVILDSKEVWGLTPGATLEAITVRPADAQLYGRGSDGRLYRISTANGFAELVSVFSLIAPGNFIGFDFSPVSDRIRLVTSDESNLRLDPSNNGVAGGAPDTALSPAGNVSAAAYTNSFVGAATTTLYAIDDASDQLVMIGGLNGTPSPNGGVVTNVGPLGVNVVPGTGTPFAGVGFDIASNGIAYAALPTLDLVTIRLYHLYTINLSTGAATLVGRLGAGGPIRSIAVAP